MKKSYSDILSVMKEAGEIMLSAEAVSVEEKSGSSNFVTQYDVDVQNFLIERVKQILPESEFLAEEKENDDECANHSCCIIIDPIDGTANFINGYRHSAISLAIVNYGVAVFGAVYDPYQNEMFYAVKGEGAYLNGNPIATADRPIERAIVAFGTTPYLKASLADKTFAVAREFFLKANDLRRPGSAALDLAYLAAGRNDIFFEVLLQPWDIAAGLLLIEEAGGIITDFEGNPIPIGKPTPVLASSKSLHAAALKITADALKN